MCTEHSLKTFFLYLLEMWLEYGIFIIFPNSNWMILSYIILYYYFLFLLQLETCKWSLMICEKWSHFGTEILLFFNNNFHIMGYTSVKILM